MAALAQAFPFRSVSLQGALGVWRFKPKAISGLVVRPRELELDFSDPAEGVRAMRAFEVAGCARLRVRLHSGPLDLHYDIERPDLAVLPRAGALARITLTAKLVVPRKRWRLVRAF